MQRNPHKKAWAKMEQSYNGSMDENLKKEIEFRFAELPEDVQRAITSAEVGKKIQEVAAKHQLHVDQVGALHDEVYMAMLGFTDIGEFAKNISTHANIPPEKAEEVAADVGTALFIPIRESMQDFMAQRALQDALVAENAEEKEAPSQAAPLPTPPKPTSASSAATAITPTAQNNPHPADVMLSQKTISVAPPSAPVTTPAVAANPKPSEKPTTPQPYKADPYREPIQ